MVLEARADPVDLVVGEQLRFAELAAGDRPRMAGARNRPRAAPRTAGEPASSARGRRCRAALRRRGVGPCGRSRRRHQSRGASSLSWRADLQDSYFRARRRFTPVRIRHLGGRTWVRWGSAPDPGRARAQGRRRRRSRCRGGRRGAARRLADRQSAHAGSRRTGLPRRSVRPARLRGLGRRTGTRATTCPATACWSPPLGSLLGVRLVGVLAVLASTRSFERLVARRLAAATRAGEPLFFAVAAVGDVWIGRDRVRARRHASRWARCSPSRGAAGSSAGRARRPVRRREPGRGRAARARGAHRSRSRGARLATLVALAAPVAAVVIALALLFPEGGFEPYPLRSFLATAVVVGGVPLRACRPSSGCCGWGPSSICSRACSAC